MTATLQTTNIQNATSSTTNLALDTSGNVTVGSSLTAANNITATSGTVVMASSFLRNKIINGAMVIDQRNAGASFTATNNSYMVDRYVYYATQASKFTAGQNLNSVTPPAGYSNYLGFQVSSSYSVSSTDYFICEQPIEGYNVFDLAWGTANAKTVTLSFQVYSSLTGTFGGSLQNSAQNRSYPFTYTISSANTWTSINITITGDTIGTWVTNNGVGIRVNFSLGAGSSASGTAGSWAGANYWSATGATSVVGTSSATFYITGVQLEVGSVATPFERRQYGQELALSQRYYCKTFSIGTVPADNTTTTGALRGTARIANSSGQIEPAANWKFPVTMRTAPTITLYSSGTGSTTGQWNNDGSTSYSANARSQFISDNNADINNAGVVLTQGVPWQIQAAATAEL